MICFRDMTFCKSDCVNSECHRHFGDEERFGAERWWKNLEGEPPVAFSDFSGNCDSYIKPETTEPPKENDQ